MRADTWLPIIARQPAHVTDVALTFDDGPHPETTPAILDLLRKHRATATFFFSGVRVSAYPDLVARTVDAGHAVFGHGWDHVDLERASSATILADLQRVESLLCAVRPTPRTYLIRLPYNAGYRRRNAHDAAGLFHANACFACWSISTCDWLLARHCPEPGNLIRRCEAVGAEFAELPSLAGSVVLMHEAPFGAEGALASQVAKTLLLPVLSALERRGLRAGPIVIDPTAKTPRSLAGPRRFAELTVRSLPPEVHDRLLDRIRRKLTRV